MSHGLIVYDCLETVFMYTEILEVIVVCIFFYSNVLKLMLVNFNINVNTFMPIDTTCITSITSI